MSGVWSAVVVILLPIPLTFLLLLSLPTPKSIKKMIMSICKNTLAIQTLGVLTLFHFLMVVAAITFAAQVWGTKQMHDRYTAGRGMDLSPCEKSQLLGDKWRHERNFWLSALMFSLWIILNRFYQMNASLVELHDKLEGAQANNAPENAIGTAEFNKLKKKS